MTPFFTGLAGGLDGIGGFGFGRKKELINLPDLIVPAAINAPGEWNFATNGNLVLTTPGTYNITVNKTLSKTVKMWGAGGGGSSWSQNGGAGGAAVGTVNFTVGPYVFVVGTRGIRIDASGGAIPGYGSGGISNPTPGGATWATPASYYGGSGGGGTGIHNGVDAILVAGGGGGGSYGTGGAGGGTTGADGTAGQGGKGGTSTTPGAGGPSSGGGPAPLSQSSAGGTFSVLTGSNGGNSSGNQPYISAGGGGGGWRGGGGGGNFYASDHGGGGGGSGYSNPAFVTSATLYSGSGTTAGNNTDPLYSPTYGFGGAANATAPSTNGGIGAIIVVA